jgi:Zn-dependent M28 family amino/carboxypeptidase
MRPYVCLAALLVACAPTPAPPPATPAAPPAPVATTSTTPAPVAPPPVAAPAPAAPALPPTVTDLQRVLLASHGAADAVQTLTTDVGPRLAGSPGDKLAVTWALDAMKVRGLTNVRAEKVTVKHWERGAETALVVAPVKQRLAVTALGWSGATPDKGIEGDVIRFESLDALKKADAASVAKKIVFLDVHMRRAADGHGYGEAVSARGAGPETAAKKGAAAIVIRSIGTDRTRFPHTGATHQEDKRTALPAGALSNADADLLANVLASHGSARLALTLTPKWLPDAESANVVGEVVGRDKPDEIILLGAHLDSWDLATGAIDDGAGCAIVLEAARALAALPQKPRRTVRVVLFAQEENALSGAKEYARAHGAEAAKHVVAMEADSGTDRVLALRFLGAPEAKPKLDALAPLLAPLGIKPTDDPAFGGADVSPLRALGVPLVDLEQDFTRYFDVHHTANDTFSQIDPDGLAQASAAFATAAWTIAEMDGDFGRLSEAQRERKF